MSQLRLITQPKPPQRLRRRFVSEAPNPWGANQFVLDPRQKLCWDSYVNPRSETFGNVTASARKAGYEESYCDTISQSEWFCAKMWKLNATFSGEKKMRELLDLPLAGEDGKIDIGIARIQADLAKYLTSTLGKDEGYSTKTETDITTGGDKINSLAELPPEVATEMRRIYEDAMKKKLTKAE